MGFLRGLTGIYEGSLRDRLRVCDLRLVIFGLGGFSANRVTRGPREAWLYRWQRNIEKTWYGTKPDVRNGTWHADSA